MSEKSENPFTLLTPPFKLSYPRVFDPRKTEYDNGETAFKWSISMLFRKSQAKDLIAMRKAGVAAITSGKSKIPQANQAKLVEYLKSPAFFTREKIGKIRLPFKDGDEADDEVYKGCISLNAGATKSAQRSELPVFIMVDNKAVRLDPENPKDVAEIYAGCICRALVTAFTYDRSGAGLSFGLNALTKYRDGERIDSSVDAEAVFNEDPNEYTDPFEPSPTKSAGPEIEDEEELEEEGEGW